MDLERKGGDLAKLSERELEEILRLANILYFREKVWDRTHWMGIKTAKCPMDMWVYQELIVGSRPDVLIETGTLEGGSALFFAQIFDLLGKGRVLTVDLLPREGRPAHDRIEYVTGSSIDPAVVGRLRQRVVGAGTVMVILDADHRKEHVLRELELYGELVTPGSYLVVEDSAFDEFPAWPEYGPGPAAAIREFLAGRTDFEIDRSLEKHRITFAPKGFLRKVSGSPGASPPDRSATPPGRPRR